MPDALTFTTEWISLKGGDPEERATFGAIGLKVGDVWLSEGMDKFTNSTKEAPLLSGFYLAEWIAWHWWRLRWEPRPHPLTIEWKLAHKFTSVGNGYVWPDVTVWFDGKRILLTSQRSDEDPNSTYHYDCDFSVAIPPQQFERAVDKFMNSVCNRMKEQGIRNSNLHNLWQKLQSDRREPEIHRRRKLEALMGFDPEDAESEILDTLINEATNLGEDAVDELAAAGIVAERPGITKKLENIARTYGFKVSKQESFSFHRGFKSTSAAEYKPAWVAGTRAAKALRNQASLGDGPISNKKLCEIAAVPGTSLKHAPPYRKTAHQGMAFVLDEDGTQRMVLRSKWESGRRFELARLVGDRLLGRYSGRLHPATQTGHTYRQQLQRAFAAEFLSPFNAIEDELADDLSDENQQLVAERFNVSPMTILRQLENNGVLDQDDLGADRLLHSI